MPEIKETTVKATDMVNITWTAAAKHNKPGTTTDVHVVSAEKLVASGVAEYSDKVKKGGTK